MKLLLGYLTTASSPNPEQEKLALFLSLLQSAAPTKAEATGQSWHQQQFLFSASQELDVLQQVDFFLRQHRVAKQTLTSLALVQGPGRFTPLRSCVMVFKTLAYALALPLFAASAFEACAQQLTARKAPILLLHSSRRGRLFVALCYQKKIWGAPLELSFLQLREGLADLQKNPKLQTSLRWWEKSPLPAEVEARAVVDQSPKVVFCDAASKYFLAAYPTALSPSQQLSFSFELHQFAGYVREALSENKNLSTAAKLTLSPYYGRSFH